MCPVAIVWYAVSLSLYNLCAGVQRGALWGLFGVRSAFHCISCMQESSKVPCGDCLVCGQPFSLYLVCRSIARCPVATVWFAVSLSLYILYEGVQRGALWRLFGMWSAGQGALLRVQACILLYQVLQYTEKTWIGVQT